MRSLGIAIAVVLGLAGNSYAQAYESVVLTGTVKANSGAVPVNATVHAVPAAMPGLGGPTTNVQADGTYRLELPVGEYRVDAMLEWTTIATATVTLVANTAPTYHFTFAGGYVGAQVTRDGAADLGAEVFIEAADPVPGCGAPNATCDGDEHSCYCQLDNGRQYHCYNDPNLGLQCQWAGALRLQTHTDATGVAKRLVPVGLYKVTVGSSSPLSAPGPMPGPMPGMTQNGYVIVGSQDGLDVADSGTALAGPIAYQTATVSGQVLHNGQPLTGVTVEAVAGMYGRIAGWVDETGTYSLRLPTVHAYTVAALQDGSSVIGSEPNVLLMPGETRDLDFNLVGSPINGTLYVDGAPAIGADVRIQMHSPTSCDDSDSCSMRDDYSCQCERDGQEFACHLMGGSQWQCYWFGGGQFSAFTDFNGQFSKLVPPGTYDVHLMSAWVPPTDPMSMMGQWGSVLVASESNVVVGASPVTIGPFSYSTGIVSGSATSCGEPLAMVSYELRPSQGTQLGSISTGGMGGMNDNSAYTLRAPVGNYTLLALLNWTRIASRAVTLSSTPETWDVSYDLGALRGRMLRNGEPSTNSQVMVSEVAVGLSCEAAASCEDTHLSDFGVCFGCVNDDGRRFWCTGSCNYEDRIWHNLTTGSDGYFTVDTPPGRYHIVAFSGTSSTDPMNPGGGQQGGVIVGQFDVDVAACVQTDVNVEQISIPASTTPTTVEFDDIGLSLGFETVEAGAVSYVVTPSPPPNEPEPPFQVAGDYYDIVVPDFTGSVLVCLPFDVERLGGEPPALWHNHQVNGWEDITEYTTADGRVCGHTDSFSWYAVGTRAVSEPDLVITAPIADLVADAACTGHATLSATGGTTYTWRLGMQELGTGSAIQVDLPLGANVVTVSSGSRTGTATIHVVDTTPPTLAVAPSPATLWPPNGKLVSIAPNAIVHDNCDTAPTVTALRASSSTATPADIAVTPTSVSLRAFRAGTETAGRTYAIDYVATDDAGNSATASGTVTVPHSQR